MGWLDILADIVKIASTNAVLMVGGAFVSEYRRWAGPIYANRPSLRDDHGIAGRIAQLGHDRPASESSAGARWDDGWN